MDSIKNLRWRYAVKKFDENKTLSQAQVTLLKEAFNLTATSYGLQALKLVIIHNKEIQQKLLAHSWNQPKIVQASHIFVLCVPKTLTEQHIDDYFNRIKEVKDTTDEALTEFKSVLKNSLANKTEKEIFEWTKNQAYIALGNLLTVAANERIDTCPMEGFSAEKYDEVLALKARNLTSILVMPAGFRAEDDPMNGMKKVRRKLEDMVIEIS